MIFALILVIRRQRSGVTVSRFDGNANSSEKKSATVNVSLSSADETVSEQELSYRVVRSLFEGFV